MDFEEEDDLRPEVLTNLSTSAQLLLRLEAALYELTYADDLIAASSSRSADLRELRRSISVSRADLQRIFDWVSEAPIEEPRN